MIKNKNKEYQMENDYIDSNMTSFDNRDLKIKIK